MQLRTDPLVLKVHVGECVSAQVTFPTTVLIPPWVNDNIQVCSVLCILELLFCLLKDKVRQDRVYFDACRPDIDQVLAVGVIQSLNSSVILVDAFFG
jgi:hypothetical protein